MFNNLEYCDCFDRAIGANADAVEANARTPQTARIIFGLYGGRVLRGNVSMQCSVLRS
jgi:hypothetical protein